MSIVAAKTSNGLGEISFHYSDHIFNGTNCMTTNVERTRTIDIPPLKKDRQILLMWPYYNRCMALSSLASFEVLRELIDGVGGCSCIVQVLT